MTTKLDFVLELPPDLVAVILSYLTFTDVLSCLLVCWGWRDTILHLRPYWINRLRGLGVSLGTVTGELDSFPNHRDLYLAVRRHLSVAKSLNLVCSVPICHPHFVCEQKQCFVSKHGVVVWRERAQGVNCLRVEEVISGGEVVYGKRLGSVVLVDDLPVQWAHYTSNGCVYWADSSGRCSGYDVRNNKKLCPPSTSSVEEVEERVDAEIATLRCEGEGGGERGGLNEVCDGAQVMLSGCQECSVVVLYKTGSKHTVEFSDINLCVARLDETEVAPMETVTTRITHKHTVACQNTRLASRGTGLASGPGLSPFVSGYRSMGTGGACEHHYVLLQDHFPTTTIIVAMKLVGDTCTSSVTIETWHECFTCSQELPVRLRDTKPSVCGGSQVGLVHGKVLYVWEVQDKQLGLVSKAEIVVQNCCKLVLVALGKHLSIVQRTGRKLCTPLEDEIYIIQTESGRVLNTISASPSVFPSSCCWYLLSREAERWLCDITAPDPPLLLTVMCDRSTAGGVAFALIRQAKPKQHQQHWVQAINQGFQQSL